MALPSAGAWFMSLNDSELSERSESVRSKLLQRLRFPRSIRRPAGSGRVTTEHVTIEGAGFPVRNDPATMGTAAF
jgi:hypothetical protein